MERRDSLYEQWQAALLSPTFDAEQLRAVHQAYQTKLQREAEWRRLWDEAEAERKAEWRRLWDEAEAERKAECEEITRRVQMQYRVESKEQVFAALTKFIDFGTYAGRIYKTWTKGQMIEEIADYEQRAVVGTAERTQAKWNAQHPLDPILTAK